MSTLLRQCPSSRLIHLLLTAQQWTSNTAPTIDRHPIQAFHLEFIVCSHRNLGINLAYLIVNQTFESIKYRVHIVSFAETVTNDRTHSGIDTTRRWTDIHHGQIERMLTKGVDWILMLVGRRSLTCLLEITFGLSLLKRMYVSRLPLKLRPRSSWASLKRFEPIAWATASVFSTHCISGTRTVWLPLRAMTTGWEVAVASINARTASVPIRVPWIIRAREREWSVVSKGPMESRTRIRSKADGQPPRWTWPRIVTRVSYFRRVEMSFNAQIN